MKDTFYFPHDYNSYKDPKCSALIKDFGAEGYGVYWMIIEIMHEQGGKLQKFKKLYDGLAFQLMIDLEKFKKIINALIYDFELFKEDENFIWSERVLKNLKDRETKRNIRAMAGQKGGIASGVKRSKTKQCFEANEANEPKERKGKERKEKKIEKIYKKEISVFLEHAKNLSRHLLEKILANNPNFKYTDSSLANWTAEIEKMLRIDSRTTQQITEVIDYAQQDNFWRPNILSAEKLRKHFDRLWLQKNNPVKTTKSIFLSTKQ